MDTYRLRAQGNTLEVVKEADDTLDKAYRTRKPTVLKLQQLAKRSKKCDRIKREIAENKYYVDSVSIAKALLNIE